MTTERTKQLEKVRTKQRFVNELQVRTNESLKNYELTLSTYKIESKIVFVVDVLVN